MKGLIGVQVEGLERVKRKISLLSNDLSKYMSAAGQEISREVLDTRGLRRYPPATAANSPPAPYYKRGVGTQRYGRRSSGGKFISGNLHNSEQLGKRWQINSITDGVRIYNDASYAPYVNGEEASAFYGKNRIGCAFDIAKQKTPQIKKIFEAWINKLIKDKGL